jgi:tetratricopeptide (TPR) repeat protein
MPTRRLPAALAALLIAAPWASAQAEKTKPADKPKPADKAKAKPKPAGPTDAELKAKALELNSITSDDASRAKLGELFKDKDEAKRLVEVAAKALKDGGDKSPFKYNATLLLGKLAVLTKDWDAAEAFFTSGFENAELLQSGKKMLESYLILVEVLNERKKFAAAEKLTKRLIENGGQEADGAQLQIMEKLILTLAKAGKTDEAVEKIDGLIGLIDKDRALWYFVKMKGDVYREADQYEKAIEKYREAAELVLEAKGFPKAEREGESRSIRYLLTGVYVDNKQPAKAIELLKELIEETPDRSTFYNDLGFVMADSAKVSDKELGQAEDYVRKALKLDADLRAKLLKAGTIDEEVAKDENSAYLDSLGWVLYKQGKYEEAYKYLEKASKDPEEGNHIEIWDHVADCLMKLDRKGEAVKVWEKALKLDDATKRDIERRKRVEAKLKAAKAGK